MRIELDASDVKILDAMQDDATLSTVELAARAGLSQSVCWRRLQRLRSEGVIRQESALLDREKLGLETLVYVQVKLSVHGRANLSEFSDTMMAYPEIQECHLVMGAYDFLLKIVVEDIGSYERFFLERLSRTPGVQEFNSMVAMSEVKSTARLPVRAWPEGRK
jgi:Lrp/AsnC family transcriptional regulator